MLVLHAIGWQLAAGALPPFAAARAGVRLFALVSVPQGAQVPFERRAADARAPGVVPAFDAQALPAPRAPALAPGPERASSRVTPASRAPAGAGGALSALAPAANAPAWPVYATRAPPSLSLRYAVAQQVSAAASAPAAGSAVLEWSNSGGAFTLRLAAAVAGRPPRDWESTGRFDSAGVAPEHLVERERGRDKRSVSFDHDGARVRFSSAPGALAVAPGAQDRWSWIAQLAAIAEAGARRHGLAGPWTLQVAGLRGDLERWTFRVLPPDRPPPGPSGNELSAPPDRAPGLLHVLRAPDRPYDLRIEAWLSPDLHHFPAALRMSTPPGPWSLTLTQPGT